MAANWSKSRKKLLIYDRNVKGQNQMVKRHRKATVGQKMRAIQNVTDGEMRQQKITAFKDGPIFYSHCPLVHNDETNMGKYARCWHILSDLSIHCGGCESEKNAILKDA